jgi:hypothetical protein
MRYREQPDGSIDPQWCHVTITDPPGVPAIDQTSLTVDSLTEYMFEMFDLKEEGKMVGFGNLSGKLGCEIMHLLCESMDLRCEIMDLRCEIMDLGCKLMDLSCEFMDLGC